MHIIGGIIPVFLFSIIVNVENYDYGEFIQPINDRGYVIIF